MNAKKYLPKVISWFRLEEHLEEVKNSITPIVPITQTNYDAIPQPINDGKLYVIVPE